MNLLKRTALCLGFCALGACAFAPRGGLGPTPGFKCISLSPYNPYSAFDQALERDLRKAGISLQNKETAGCPHVELHSHDTHSQTLAYAPTGEVRRERLQLKLLYSFYQSNGDLLTRNKAVQASRERLININLEHADEFEREVLEEEMQHDAFAQLIRQLQRTISSHAN